LYALVSSTSFTSWYPYSLFPIHNTTILMEYTVKSSLAISPCHDPDLSQYIAYTENCLHLVEHSLSAVFTKDSLHRVLHTLSTAYTQYSTCQERHSPIIVWLPIILMILCWPVNGPSVWSYFPAQLTAIGQLSMRVEWKGCLVTFPWLWVN
jgi:hypothetical protein